MAGSLKLNRYRPKIGFHRNSFDLYSPDRKLGTLSPRYSEVAVGGIAKIGGKKYKVVEAELNANCHGCDLLIDGICHKETKHPCSAYSRSDKTWVIFKAIKKDGSSK